MSCSAIACILHAEQTTYSRIRKGYEPRAHELSPTSRRPIQKPDLMSAQVILVVEFGESSESIFGMPPLSPSPLRMHTVPEMLSLLSPNSTTRITLRGGEIWRRNLRLSANWRSLMAPSVPRLQRTPTIPHRIRAAWRLRAARAYAEIAPRGEDDFEDVTRTIDDPHDACVMLEQSYGSQQSGIQSVINSESTLARWDGQTPVNVRPCVPV